MTKNASEFQTQNRNLNLQIKQLEDTLQHLKKENKLQEDIKNETTKKNILLESHVISLQSRLVIIKNKKCLLEKEINLLTENNNTLQQEIVTLKTMLLEREELVKTIDELTKHNNRLQEEKMCLVAHDTNIKKIKFLESEKNRLVSENLSSTNLLNKKIDELNRCHYVSKQKIDDLEKENQTLKSQMYEMNHTLNTQKNLQNKK